MMARQRGAAVAAASKTSCDAKRRRLAWPFRLFLSRLAVPGPWLSLPVPCRHPQRILVQSSHQFGTDIRRRGGNRIFRLTDVTRQRTAEGRVGRGQPSRQPGFCIQSFRAAGCQQCGAYLHQKLSELRAGFRQWGGLLHISLLRISTDHGRHVQRKRPRRRWDQPVEVRRLPPVRCAYRWRY